MKRKLKSKLKHPPHNAFKAFLAENGIKLKEIAEIIGTTVTTVSQKNNGYQHYTMTEVDKICNHYNISADIFRRKKVS